jgi:hypothetical protein
LFLRGPLLLASCLSDLGKAEIKNWRWLEPHGNIPICSNGTVPLMRDRPEQTGARLDALAYLNPHALTAKCWPSARGGHGLVVLAAFAGAGTTKGWAGTTKH